MKNPVEERAVELGAQGIGLTRTEHMFFDPARIGAFREMICSDTKEEREIALNKIEPMQQEDFEGFMNTSKYANMTKCSNDTALRDILELKKRGIFIQNPGKGRSTSYRLPDKKA